jgi:hypothetical protein
LNWQPVAGWHLDANLTLPWDKKILSRMRVPEAYTVPCMESHLPAIKNKNILQRRMACMQKQTRLALGDKDDQDTQVAPGLKCVEYAGIN